MDEYEEYEISQSDRVDAYYHILLGDSIHELDDLKHWLNDHNAGDAVGGIASFSSRISPAAGPAYDVLSADNEEESGKPVVVKWGEPNMDEHGHISELVGDHAMTIVGYNDNIKYDFNGDGYYTNDIDILGQIDAVGGGEEEPDGIIDLRDCEIGAFLVANSWGTNWPAFPDVPQGTPADGYIWMPYRTIWRSYMSDTPKPDYLPWIDIARDVVVPYVEINIEPQILIKANIDYRSRWLLSANTGVAPYANSVSPLASEVYVPLDAHRGGGKYMDGYSGPVEFAYDITELANQNDAGKFFFEISNTEMDFGYVGNVEYFSLIDYRFGEEFEIYSKQTNMQIIDGETTILWIEYDLLEENINENLSIFSNRVSRFASIIGENAVLSIDDDCKIDFYGGNVKTETGGSTVINSNFNLFQKTEDNIYYRGDIQINENASLTLMLNLDFNSNLFLGGSIINPNATVTCKNNSQFTQQYNTNVNIENGSILHLETGSLYEISSASVLRIESGSTLKIESCAELNIIGTGQLIVESGAILEIEAGAILAFNKGMQNIDLQLGYIVSAGYIDPADILPPVTNITQNTTWDNKSYQISSNINIEENATLNLTNSQLTGTNFAKITIHTGGKLIIDNSTLTNNTCKNDLWKGITVLGNPELSQFNEANQGVLEVKNGSVIENAVTGIFVGRVELQGNEAGGIVKIENNVVFRNCITAVHFLPYSSDVNKSYINNCTFETTDYLAGIGQNPESFVSLYGVNGVSIYQSSFTNLNPEAYTYDNRGKGIKLFSSNSLISQNDFQNLRYGMFTQGTSDLSVLFINENSFTDNLTGIYAEAAGNYTIYDNDFDLSLYVPGTNATGIEAYYNTETFTIEENNFTGNHSGNETGIYAAENSANLNLYKNTFSGIKSGIVLYNNPNLQIECNEFTNCYYGTYINEDGAFGTQGNLGHPAANNFSGCFGFDLYANHIFDLYSYYYDPANLLHASNVNSNINLISILLGNNDCPSHFGIGGSFGSLAVFDEEINENEIILASITDGGDTEGTNEDVDNSNPNEALKLRNKLLEKSPNLSDTVMINATMTENVLPSVMLTQVLSENPQAAKSGNVNAALDNRNNQLPYYMRNAIDQGRFSTSLKEDLESEIAHLRNERARIYTGLLAKYSNDTTQNAQDSLLLLMQNETDLRGQYRLMSYYMSKKDRANAQNIFNSIPANFEFTAKEENEYNAMTELNNVLFNLIDEEKSLFGVDSTQREIINTLSKDTVTYAGAYARGIMTLIDTVDHISVFPMPEENRGDKGTDPIVYSKTFKVYPQIANDYFIIEYALDEKENIKDINIALFDNAGTKLMNFDVKTQANQFLAECEHLKAGIYWCRKFNKGKVTDEEKVVIDRDGIVINETDIFGNSDNSSGYDETEGLTLRIKIYPNPAKDYFFISCNLKEIQAEDIIMQITDSKGVTIKKIELDKNTNQSKISTSSWAKGVYFVNITANDKVIETMKLVIK